MFTRVLFLFSVLLLQAVALKTCGERCRFTHCNVASTEPSQKRPRRLLLRPPLKVGNGPVICISNSRDRVGRILKTGEPILEFRKGVEVKMSEWRPEGLSKPFARKFFQTKEVKPYVKSDIVKKPNQGNQQEFLDDLCVRLPISEYEVLNKKTRKVQRKEKGGAPEDCIAFQTRAVDILIELNWGGRDDLDLKIIEPDGDELNRFNPATEAGGFAFDTSERCFKDQVTGKETATYRKGSGAERGKYTVEVRHFENCNVGPTKWNLRVTVEGVLVMEKSGKSNRDFSELITKQTFKY